MYLISSFIYVDVMLFCSHIIHVVGLLVLYVGFGTLDLTSHSLPNFRGEPKCWYSVPGNDAQAFEKVLLLHLLPGIFLIFKC